VRGVREGDHAVAANSAPCRHCALCLAGRPNLCEDLLFVNGAYGEFIALPARLVEANLVRLQPATAAARAAFAEPLACALGAVERARVEGGQTVAVFGHGPLGCLLAMVAAARKARVILVGKRGWRLDRVRSLGIAEVRDATATDDVVADMRAATGGRGPEVTIDATGRPEVWKQAIDAVGRGGCVVFFGGCAPGTAVSVDTRRAHYEELSLLGAFHHTPDLIRRAVELLEAGTVEPEALITHRRDLGGVRAALELMATGDALKVLIEP
jgi:L-iditol 2-dehydrogenase